MKKDRHGHRKLTAFTLRIMGEIGGIIAAPVVLLTWVARRANVIFELESRPKVMAVSLLLSFVISTVALCIRATDYGEQYEVLTDKPVDADQPGGGGGRDGPPADRNYG
ncbi:MAG TPA: hypothetical protein VL426_02815 [Candidatus Binatia bacterium]|jgi:hypothetical protein|nr:hypothetical protein [Candidatus Binatia bacterium]